MSEFKKSINLVDRKLKYKGSIMNVYNDSVNVDGNIVHWDYIEKSNAAAIIPVLENGNIVMVRQYRLAVNEWTLEIPAGKLDGDEDYIVCARRELEEETGYKSDNIVFLCDCYAAVAFCSEVIRVFVAKDLKNGIQHFDRDEEIVTEEWALENLKKEIYLGNIKDSKTIAGIMSYANKLIK